MQVCIFTYYICHTWLVEVSHQSRIFEPMQALNVPTCAGEGWSRCHQEGLGNGNHGTAWWLWANESCLTGNWFLPVWPVEKWGTEGGTGHFFHKLSTRWCFGATKMPGDVGIGLKVTTWETPADLGKTTPHVLFSNSWPVGAIIQVSTLMTIPLWLVKLPFS